jgi:hypothetical protein
MTISIRSVLYQGLCWCAALAVASYAILPVSRATANALSYRGGQVCLTGGCHDKTSSCTGTGSCSAQTSTACLTGDKDRNGKRCGDDTGLCRNMGCAGADVRCGS